MTTIYVLLVAHFVGDFICQSDWMALNKSKRWDALALHAGMYIATLMLTLLVGLWLVLGGDTEIGGPPWVWFMVVNGAAHFVQDAITSRINARLWFVRTEFAGTRWRELYRDADGSGCSTEAEAFFVDYLPTRHWFFVAIGFDQLLHFVTLFVTAGWWLR